MGRLARVPKEPCIALVFEVFVRVSMDAHKRAHKKTIASADSFRRRMSQIFIHTK